MKRNRLIIYTVLIVASLVCMFLPIATFHDNTIASLNADIVKEEGAVTRAADKLVRENDKVKGLTIEAVPAEGLQALLAEEMEAAKPNFESREGNYLELFNWQTALDAKRADLEEQKATGNVTSADLDKEIAASDARYAVMIKIVRQQIAIDAMEGDEAAVAKVQKTQDAVYKQLGKVNKEQAGVNNLLAQKAELEKADSASGLKHSLLPGKLPAEIQINMQVVNENAGVYPTDFSLFYIMTWVGAALLLLALGLVWAGGCKPVSKFYTFASFCNILAFVAIAYSVLRLNAIPVKLPYSNPVMNWPVALIAMLAPLAALLLHCTTVTNTKRSMIYVLCIFLCVLSLLPFWLMIVNATRNAQRSQGGVSLIPAAYL